MGFEILSIGNPDNDDSWPPLRIGQRTRVMGEPGIFVIVGVNRDSQTADLIASAGISPVLPHIPFAQMRPPGTSHYHEAEERILPFRS
ncbi:MAG: hypothetical protein ACLGSD_03800 [Acidobacteriota bacterium]